MTPRRFPSATAMHDQSPSSFDRLTFTTCMLTVAVVVAVLTSYGPAAAMHHIADVVRTAPVIPATEADLYSLSAMPF